MIRKGRWKVLFDQLGKPTRTRLCVLLSSPQILGIVWIYSHLIRARAGTETVPVARVSRFQDMLWAVSSFNAQFRKADLVTHGQNRVQKCFSPMQERNAFMYGQGSVPPLCMPLVPGCQRLFSNSNKLSLPMEIQVWHSRRRAHWTVFFVACRYCSKTWFCMDIYYDATVK